ERALARRQLKALATATVERNTVDVAKALDTLLPVQPDSIVQISAYKSCAAFIKQSRARGFGGQFFNVSFVGSKALADELGEMGGFRVGYGRQDHVGSSFVEVTTIARGGRFLR